MILFMVVEQFEGRDLKAVGERFKRSGRMLPDGVVCVASWIEVRGSRCYQLMEAPDRTALDTWIARWDDLAGFEVFEVLTSAQFWSKAWDSQVMATA